MAEATLAAFASLPGFYSLSVYDLSSGTFLPHESSGSSSPLNSPSNFISEQTIRRLLSLLAHFPTKSSFRRLTILPNAPNTNSTDGTKINNISGKEVRLTISDNKLYILSLNSATNNT